MKYIALLAFVKIVPSHPHLVAQYQDMILSSVNDQDISIRLRALDLLSAMVRFLFKSSLRVQDAESMSRSLARTYNQLSSSYFPTLSALTPQYYQLQRNP